MILQTESLLQTSGTRDVNRVTEIILWKNDEKEIDNDRAFSVSPSFVSTPSVGLLCETWVWKSFCAMQVVVDLFELQFKLINTS